MRLALAPLLLVAGLAHAGDSFYGYAYDLKTGKYLYTEVHQPKYIGGKLATSTMKYYAPDGSLIGSKPLDYRSNPYIPLYRLDLPREGYSEGITSNSGGTIAMRKVSGKGKAEEQKSIAIDGVMAADSGFNNLLVDNFAELSAGKKLAFKFAVAGQLDSYKFSIQKTGSGTFNGQPSVKFLVQANSLLKYLAPDLELQYDPATKHLLEYKGVSNIHDPVSGKAYMARIIYPASPPADAPKNLPPLP